MLAGIGHVPEAPLEAHARREEEREPLELHVVAGHEPLEVSLHPLDDACVVWAREEANPLGVDRVLDDLLAAPGRDLAVAPGAGHDRGHDLDRP